MKTKKLTITETSYVAFNVWNGDYHEVELRFCKQRTIVRDRGYVHVCTQNAAGFAATRDLTIARARRGKVHRFDIKRRDLARRFLVEIEPLVRQGVVDLKFDGAPLKIRA